MPPPILLSSLPQAIFVCPFTTLCCLCVQGCSQGLAVGVPCISAKLCFACFLFGLTQELPTVLLMLVLKVTVLSFKCHLLYFIPFQDGVMSLGRECANAASRLGLWRFSHVPSPEIVISDHLSSKTQQHRWESYNHPVSVVLITAGQRWPGASSWNLRFLLVQDECWLKRTDATHCTPFICTLFLGDRRCTALWVLDILDSFQMFMWFIFGSWGNNTGFNPDNLKVIKITPPLLHYHQNMHDSLPVELDNDF